MKAVTLPPDIVEWRRYLLTDPQTSGGLPVACAARKAAEIAGRMASAGYPSVRVIGHVAAGDAAVRIDM